ncbi:MAG: multiheme c-type cytochrome [Chromatiales bacterium]
MAISVATLAWGPWAYGVQGQGFPDAEAYWAAPLNIAGDARDHHPATRDLSPGACGACHPRQYADWRDSLHASAVSPGLLGQLGALSFEERRRCFACHVPPAERQSEWEIRGLDAAPALHGVDCAACHVRDQQRFGPRERPQTPHGVVKGAAFFRESDFCAPCHQFGPEAVAIDGKPLENTHAEWAQSRYAREGRTCQSCHMRDGSHRFAGIHDPAMTARALRVTAVRTAAGVDVEVANAGAGHALPTYSVPRVRIVVSAAGQDPLDYPIQRRMDWDPENGWRELADSRLLPGEQRVLSHSLASREAQAEVTVRVEPDADYFERVYPALLDMLAGEVPAEEIDLIEAARRRAGESPYVLLRLSCPAFAGETVPCTPGTDAGGASAGSGAPRRPGDEGTGSGPGPGSPRATRQ